MQRGFNILKCNNLFVIIDQEGNLNPSKLAYSGLYYRDTRVLKALIALSLNYQLVPLDKRIIDDKFIYNYGVPVDEGLKLRMTKEIFLRSREMVYRLKMQNPSEQVFQDVIHLIIEADFQDIFEVRRGREEMEREITTEVEHKEVRFHYEGRDSILRKVHIRSNLDLAQEEGPGYFIPIWIESKGDSELELRVEVDFKAKTKGLLRDRQGKATLPWRLPRVSDPELGRLVENSRRDLETLMLNFDLGYISAAGVPWFSAIFGRDSLITALQLLLSLPELAKSTLRILARFQGERKDPQREEELGKILHELRMGELANVGKVPNPYYGSVDSTLLFLILLGKYVQETEDRDFLREIRRPLHRALSWLERQLSKGDGFIYYQQRSGGWLINQGWKDSGDAIRDKDGRVIRGRKVALVEVQGYAYAALLEASNLLKLLGSDGEGLKDKAYILKERFNREFWLDKEEYFALAMLGPGELVDSITSNPGHCLWTGILGEGKLRSVVERLLSQDMFSGFGIRTMASDQGGYNPMSYHNGSVWPHDNSLIILGLKGLGFTEEAERVAQGLLKASKGFGYRLPELFGGFDDRRGYPVPYPYACNPQAWAAGTAFIMLEALD